jgi:hypothetical protein
MQSKDLTKGSEYAVKRWGGKHEAAVKGVLQSLTPTQGRAYGRSRLPLYTFVVNIVGPWAEYEVARDRRAKANEEWNARRAAELAGREAKLTQAVAALAEIGIDTTASNYRGVTIDADQAVVLAEALAELQALKVQARLAQSVAYPLTYAGPIADGPGWMVNVTIKVSQERLAHYFGSDVQDHEDSREAAVLAALNSAGINASPVFGY